MNRRDLMSFITRALTHKERFIIEQYYQYGHTMREISRSPRAACARSTRT